MTELVVVLVVLGVLTGVAGLAIFRAPVRQTVPEWQAAVSAARDSAMRHGQAVTVIVRHDSVAVSVTALPDGRVLADPQLEIELLAGERRDAQ